MLFCKHPGMSGRKNNFDQFIPLFLCTILFHLERQSEDVVEKYPQRGLCHQLRHMFSLRDNVISLTWNRNLQSKLAFVQLTNICSSWDHVLQHKQRMFLYMVFLEVASHMWHSILIYTQYPKGLGWFQHQSLVFEQLIWEANICIDCLVSQQRRWQMYLAWQSLQLTS
jgi:hypothetical protein